MKRRRKNSQLQVGSSDECPWWTRRLCFMKLNDAGIHIYCSGLIDSLSDTSLRALSSSEGEDDTSLLLSVLERWMKRVRINKGGRMSKTRREKKKTTESISGWRSVSNTVWTTKQQEIPTVTTITRAIEQPIDTPLNSLRERLITIIAHTKNTIATTRYSTPKNWIHVHMI